MINIAISCAAGSLKKFEALYLKKFSFFRKKINLIGIDIKKNKIDKKFFDFVEKVPKAENKNYLKSLKSIILKHKIKFVFIGADEEAIVISKNIKKFDKTGAKFMINNHKTIKILSDKIATYKKLKSLKEIIPKWSEAKNKVQLMKYINIYIKKHNEVVIKPAISRGGRNVFIIKNQKITRKISNREESMNIDYFKIHFLKKIKNFYPFIVMEKLNDPVFDLDIIAEKGKLNYALLRKRLNSRDPNSGHKILKDKNIFLIAKKISKKLNLSTVNDCDFMLDKKGCLKLLEINPRPSGSFAIPNLARIHILDYILEKNLYKRSIIKLKKIKKDILLTKNQLNHLYNA